MVLSIWDKDSNHVHTQHHCTCTPPQRMHKSDVLSSVDYEVNFIHLLIAVPSVRDRQQQKLWEVTFRIRGTVLLQVLSDLPT